MDGGSSILAFVQAGLKVCKGLWTYYNAWKDYREDIAFICDSLTGIEKALTFLQDSMASRRRPQNNIHDESCRDAVQRCKRTMDRLRKKLEKIQDSNSSGGFRLQAKFQWERVKYPLKESTILKLRDLLQEKKSDLMLLLAILKFDSSIVASNQWNHLSDKMDQLSLNMANFNAYVADSQKSKDDEKHKKVLDWVCTVDPSVKHASTNLRREPGTCNWFFQRPEFDEWKTKGSILWIKGEVGRGKSVLCSAVIEYMKLHCTNTPGTLLLYYYFSFADQSEQHTAICLSSLLRQLCSECTSVMTIIQQMHEESRKDDNKPKDMAFGDVKTCLQSAIAELKKEKKEVYVVIDALDELPDDREGLQRAQILKWISETSSQETNVHILFTSRVGSSCIDIEEAMESQTLLHQVFIDAVANHDDIRLYLEGQFQVNKNLKTLGNITPVNIIEKLIEKSGGMFQWVSCQIDELKSLQIARPRDIEDVLKSMPPTLDECYMRILKSVNSRFQSEVVKALQWISLSFVPLSVKEVNEACIIDLTELSVIKEENQFTGDGITTCLSSFVTRTGYEKAQLCLSHFSVKEFLTSSTIQEGAYSRYGFREGVAHAFIAECCIAYIYYYSSCLDTRSEDGYFPLLLYACRYWFEHLRLAIEEEQERLAPLVIDFLNSWNVYSNALRVYSPLLSIKWFSCKIHTLASPLGWAATLGLEFFVKRLLNENATEIDAIQDIECFVPGHGLATESSDFPFSERCSNIRCSGSLDFILIRHRVRGTALMKAIAYDHTNVARLLIENGADLHHIEQEYAIESNSALSIACLKGNDKMVCILLEYGADPNEICGGLSALESGISSGNLEVCKILLDNGALVDGTELTKRSPLVDAAWHKQLEICKLLLDRGAEVNYTLEDEPNDPSDILSIVARYGYAELVELFLSRGAPIGSQVLFWSLCHPEALLRPSIVDRKRVCELLILHGANLNPDCKGLYNTPLAVALTHQWHDIVELMLSKGARVDPGDPSCLTSGNILIAATNSVDMARRILDMGVDVNAPGALTKQFGGKGNGFATDFSNALQASAYYHNYDVVELLLDRNADPRITCPPYGSALYAVVGRIGLDHIKSHSAFLKTQQICELLLSKGAKWDRKYGPEEKVRMTECALGHSALIKWQRDNIDRAHWFSSSRFEREIETFKRERGISKEDGGF